MTKADLIAKMAKDAKITKAQAERALNSSLEGIKMALKKEGKLTLTGFGTYTVAKRKAREGRNPQTGAVIKIKAAKVVKFKAGKVLRSAVK